MKYYHFCPKTFLHYNDSLIFWPEDSIFFPTHMSIKPCRYFFFNNQALSIQPMETICVVLCQIPIGYHLTMDTKHCIHKTTVSSNGSVHQYYMSLKIKNINNHFFTLNPNESLKKIFEFTHNMQVTGVVCEKIEPFE